MCLILFIRQIKSINWMTMRFPLNRGNEKNVGLHVTVCGCQGFGPSVTKLSTQVFRRKISVDFAKAPYCFNRFKII